MEEIFPGMRQRTLDDIIKDYFGKGTSAFLPHISINVVVFAYDHPHLKVLAHRIPGQELWILPGGYVKKEEDLDEAACRNLRLTGIGSVFLRQVRTFGETNRLQGLSAIEQDVSPDYASVIKWITQRFITVVYYGLVKFSDTKLAHGGISAESKWMEVNGTDELVMDHAGIIDGTRKVLAGELMDHPVAENLLPVTFTMNELRGLYESILGRNIDRGTFRRKILRQGILDKVGKIQDTPGRPADIFMFNHDSYFKSLQEETRFGF